MPISTKIMKEATFRDREWANRNNVNPYTIKFLANMNSVSPYTIKFLANMNNVNPYTIKFLIYNKFRYNLSSRISWEHACTYEILIYSVEKGLNWQFSRERFLWTETPPHYVQSHQHLGPILTICNTRKTYEVWLSLYFHKLADVTRGAGLAQAV
jgi:hypothetical protein